MRTTDPLTLICKKHNSIKPALAHSQEQVISDYVTVMSKMTAVEFLPGTRLAAPLVDLTGFIQPLSNRC